MLISVALPFYKIAYTYFFPAKKMKDSLSSFLPQLPGVIDTPGVQDNSSLRGLYEKPPGMCIHC